MKLHTLLVADPVLSTAKHIAAQCQRLADVCVVATNSEQLADLARRHQPEIIIASAELSGGDARKNFRALRQLFPESLVVATYRELSVATIRDLKRIGIEHVVCQPVDMVTVFRAASDFFQRQFRRHDRHDVSLVVRDVQDNSVGETLDVSSGGMLLELTAPLTGGASLMFNVTLPEGKPLRLRGRILEVLDNGRRARVQFENVWDCEQRRLDGFLNTLGEELLLAAA